MSLRTDAIRRGKAVAIFESPSEMAAANERFVTALVDARMGKRVVIGAPSDRLTCGHDPKHSYRYGGHTYCRKCKTDVREQSRTARLPEMTENARRKLEALERECIRKGVIV